VAIALEQYYSQLRDQVSTPVHRYLGFRDHGRLNESSRCQELPPLLSCECWPLVIFDRRIPVLILSVDSSQRGFVNQVDSEYGRQNSG